MLSLSAAARDNPDGVAIIDGDRSVCFAELHGLSEQLADSLELERHRDRTVALAAHNDLATIALIHALLDRHITTLPVNPRLTSVEQRQLVEQANADWLGSSDSGFIARSAPAGAQVPATVAARRPQLLVATSGSSGRPKLVCLSSEALHASASASVSHLAMTARDRWLLSLNLGHIGGVAILLRCLLAGAAVVRADPAMAATALAKRMELSKVTLASMVPAQLARFLALDPIASPKTLRAILVGGARCPLPLAQRARNRGLPVLLTYGLSETASQVATQPLTDLERQVVRDDVGRALDGFELKVVHDVIHLRGAALFDGYYGETRSPFDQHGWYATGDLGALSANGRLTTLGRRDDIIVTGGEKVSSLEVEAALVTQPEIHAAAVVGLPDENWGQIVAAVVVFEGLATSTAVSGSDVSTRFAALEAQLSALLAPFKRPRRWLEVQALPLLPSGKLDRPAARALFARVGGSSNG